MLDAVRPARPDWLRLGARQLYSWDVPARGHGGVARHPATAISEVVRALQGAPAGSVGTVQGVVLSGSGHAEYDPFGEATRFHRDADGTVTLGPGATHQRHPPRRGTV
ncbi:hypothetical protein [Actinomadura sp. 21ATH]|uniref:hypothetical protein n=1 Tax=Actinomadura sp. 21ATH TaxID=1735444 RepID=UPI0035C18D25